MPELIPDYDNGSKYLEDDNSEDGNSSRVFLDGEGNSWLKI